MNMKKQFIFLSALAFIAAAFISCTEPVDPQPGPDEQEKPADLKALKHSVEVTDNWVWDARPALSVVIENPNDVAVTATIKTEINTDLKKFVTTVEQTAEVPAKGKKTVIVTTEQDLEPGFYKAKCFVGNAAKTFTFGISPYDIVSAPDMQPDFDEYWANAKLSLPELVEGETVKLIEVTPHSSANSKVYLVEMQSAPNSPDGEPVIVRGFYVEPQDGQKHPVIMHFFGWDDRGGSVTVPSGGSGAYAEFYLSTRGQYHNNRAAAYEKKESWIAEHGEWYAADPCDYASIMKPNDKYNWFGFNFGDKDGFYYRGAFLDCVQAVRFMASRPTSDMTNLFAEGSSQGGALSYACAALSDYPFSAIACNVAFLGDYPDYFRIVTWPGDTAKANKGSMTDEEMYAFLSYYDTKNLATKISCAVLASSGLQDGTCPPHTNFAAFNNVNTTDKEMIIDPKMGHSYPAGWSTKQANFFKERIK